MPLTDVGRNLISNALVGAAYNAYNAANARICVGNSSQAFAKADTDMVGTKFRKAMDGGFPTQATNVLTFQATMATGEANFDWNEWGVANHASAGELLNRKVEVLGTKTSAQSWQIQVALTVTNP